MKHLLSVVFIIPSWGDRHRISHEIFLKGRKKVKGRKGTVVLTSVTPLIGPRAQKSKRGGGGRRIKKKKSSIRLTNRMDKKFPLSGAGDLHET